MYHKILSFLYPPVPYYIGCGGHNYGIGEKHLTRHNVGLFVLIVVREGELYIGEDNDKWTLRKNDALFLRPDLLHYGFADCNEHTKIQWVHFSTIGAWGEFDSITSLVENQLALKSKHQFFGIPAHLTVSVSIPKFSHLSESAVGLINEIIEANSNVPGTASWKQQALFQHLFTHINLEPTEQQYDIPIVKVAELVKQYVSQHYQESITNDSLKQSLNYHPNYLAKCMKTIYGVTPLEYLNQLRLKQAKKLLLNSNMSISAIAETVGFQLSNFSNCFSKEEGLSPNAFRKKYLRS